MLRAKATQRRNGGHQGRHGGTVQCAIDHGLEDPFDVGKRCPSVRTVSCCRQTDSCFRDRSRTPHRRLCAAPPPYARTRGCAPVGSPIGWAVLLLTSTSRARTRRAPRTARALAVQDGLGAWREGGWVGRRCVWSVGCVFRGSSPASFAFPWCAGRGNYCAHRRAARRFS